uniref:Trifunctional purine biosynthetic protein adenosine-3 n=2 Tax=Drosophila melanogaster TaxID=7227 RepID=PUR2_DROME|nr:RecName: Full=Trifunctional purine biosynthetic protein adenosine-3; Includes: RecName: Full=Phosphoribosylamine--glycine ligase; AltName: Full=Glycinamide ribonucleotide synthetase; Short=GARS; AltName: Full=Phosphoribosylglycinamide synthetase; Includes: RecName: Full=Phosphoribosylformylglycinamidine cyclo-ligase; AltName: Full=AIR synthase; Short=AIRS; AltName: Full=Phosphoribosyl-aminoimidazole synthetase; Includes: RecName: Full=Phosphoribosylglycinamide formyltransferase; AltName: Full=5'
MSHRVLVIGSGGREHAICWKLSQSPKVAQIYALPGSHGIQLVEKCRNLDAKTLDPKDFEAIAKWSKENQIALVVVGPEDPLALGLGDVLQSAGIPCFGPGKQGAQIEADKKWAKDFMLRHGIPTARYESFTDTEKAKAFIRSAPYPALVVKAAGLAAGKGVVVAANAKEACQAVDEILGDLKYGQAGATLVVEELLEGEEVSVLAFTDGKSVRAMLPAQDHKRLGNGDTGPNTGGMGAYCPCPLISQPALELVQKAVLERAVQGLIKERINYQGVLYAGLMLTRDGPRVLEFNCRFGDPETQVILPLLESDLFDVMEACCSGKLDKIPLQWRNGVSAVGVILASAGYPETSTKGCIISGLPAANTPTQLVFHSGLAVNAQKEALTNGGRVLIAIALDGSLKEAAAKATKLAGSISFSGSGAQYRTDIAQKAFKIASASTPGLSYKDSGVDIDAGDALVQRIKPLSRGTQRPGVIGGLGGFGGLFRLKELTYKEPVIAEATQGVGAKIHLALTHEFYENVGYDLFALAANDVLEVGAEPVAFLDYIACGKLQVPLAAQLVKGMADGCRDARCALVGGETAEMPSLYAPGQHDMAGYCVGIVEHSRILPRFDLYQPGDLLIGLPSSGLHCAGFNEILTQLAASKVNLRERSPVDGGDDGLTLAHVLATPTQLYVQQLLPHLQKGDEIKSVAHVTHGLLNDILRLLPDGFETTLDFGAVPVPKIFGWLAGKLKLSAQTILERHNCGIGMVLILPQSSQLWRTSLPGAKVLGVLQRRSKVSGSPVQVRNFVEQLEKVASPFGGLGDRELPEELKKLPSNSDLSAPREECFENAAGRRLTRIPTHYKDPILILGTDGVGTKLKIAQQTNRNTSVGIDLVAMCVNDILCNGAEPISFSSYYACGHWQEQLAKGVHSGVQEGARQANSSFIDSHSAALPLLYEPQVYDLAGFALGIAEHTGILPLLAEIQPGDVLIGLPSSGVHSNGFSLVHAVLKRVGLGLHDKAPFSDKTLGEELLVPTKIYVKALSTLLSRGKHGIKALAHITGGGLSENIPRVLRKDLAVRLDANKFQLPPVFAWLAAAGNISSTELQRTYNCGLGMVLVVAPTEVEDVLKELRYPQRAAVVGEVVARKDPKKSQVVVQNFEASLARTQKMLSQRRKRVAVLISGTGSNLQALIDATRDSAQGIHADVVLVISNKPGVLGLQRATQAGIPSLVISHKDFASREVYDAELTRNLKAARVDLICLAGFMRVLSAPFVREWRGRLVNIHPSLLPKYPGLHVQKQALEAGEKESGCTVHFVDEGVDTGAIIVQAAVPILPDDDEDSLTQRIHKAEHWAFPRALAMLVNGTALISPEVSSQ